jgi:hypothetical protein
VPSSSAKTTMTAADNEAGRESGLYVHFLGQARGEGRSEVRAARAKGRSKVPAARRKGRSGVPAARRRGEGEPGRAAG